MKDHIKKALLGAAAAALALGVGSAEAQRAASRAPLYNLEDAYLNWPLAKEDQRYAAIDGKHLKTYVNELAQISREYRDAGHQYWGRITGTDSDVASQKWVVDSLRKAGVTDIRTVPHDLPTQWLPKSWAVTFAGNGASFSPTSAFPMMSSSPTPAGGLNLDAVYVGTGAAADLLGRDVRGKLAVVYTHINGAMWSHSAATEGAAKRLEDLGAAAILLINNTPGNSTMVMYPSQNKIPVLTVGLDDGQKIRDMLGAAGATPVRVKLDLVVDRPNLKTATILGTLPGATDETIYVVAHRDGFFEAGSDNASGNATMIGLAEYFAKIPKAQRRRTIVFVSTTGHHNNCKGDYGTCTVGGLWMAANGKQLFEKTALIINAEHTAATQTMAWHGPVVRRTNDPTEPMFWYVGGSPKLEQIVINANRSFGVATYAEPEGAPPGEIGAIYQMAPSVQVMNVNVFMHTNRETADFIPWTGLQAMTRSYAKMIDRVNTLSLQDLQRPAATGGSTPAR